MPDYSQSSTTSSVPTNEYYTTTLATAFQQFLFDEDVDRQESYRLYREYYDGKHALMLTDRQKEFLEHKADTDFLANYCQIVVDVVAERLRVLDFDVVGGRSLADAAPERLWWDYNEMDGQQVDVHTCALRDGDTYVLIEWDDEAQMPLYTLEEAFDGAEGVAVAYRDDRRSEIEYAVKYWRSTNPTEAGWIQRATVYRADSVAKYYFDSRKGGASAWALAEPPIPWVSREGKPLGVPVVHFRHKANGKRHGLSKLEIVIPLQNLLNKTLIDLVGAADAGGFRLLVMIGNEPGDNFRVHPGAILSMPNLKNEGEIKAIPGEDMRPMIETVDSMVQRIGQVTRTPLSYFQVSGQLASEGTQKQQEAGLISQCGAIAVHFGNSWERLSLLGRKVYNAFNAANEGLPLERARVIWDDFEIRDRWAHKLAQAQIVGSLTSAGGSLRGAAVFAGVPERDVQALELVDLTMSEQ